MDPVSFKMAMQLLWSLLKTKKGRKLVVAVIGIVEPVAVLPVFGCVNL